MVATPFKKGELKTIINYLGRGNWGQDEVIGDRHYLIDIAKNIIFCLIFIVK